MTSLLQKINTLDTKVDGLDSSNLQTQVTTNTNDISGIQANKQNTLIAGDNITIVGDTISASGGGSGSSFVGYRVYTEIGTHRTLLLNQSLIIDFDEGGNYINSGTDRGYFIAPSNGFYSFKGKVQLPSGSNARSYVRFFIDRGSGREPYEDFYDPVYYTNTTVIRGASGTCIAKLNAGDKFTLGLESPITSEIGGAVVTIIFSGYRIST